LTEDRPGWVGRSPSVRDEPDRRWFSLDIGRSGGFNEVSEGPCAGEGPCGRDSEGEAPVMPHARGRQGMVRVEGLPIRVAAVALVLLVLAAVPPCPAAASPARELAPGVYVLGSSDRYGSANMGFVVFDDHVLLVGAPHPDLVPRWLAEAERVA